MKKLYIIIFIFLFAVSANTAPRRVLIELGTSVDCYICPKAIRLIEDSILPHYPQSVVISIHTNLMSINSHDPYAHFRGENIRDLLKPVGGFNFPTPGIWVDRSKEAPTWYEAYDTVSYRYANMGTTPVEINVISKNYNPVTRQFSITAAVNTSQNISGTYYLCLAITEDNLIYKQEGVGNNFVHNRVLRDMVSGARGEQVSSGIWQQNQQVTKSYSTFLDTGWTASNCRYALYVYKSCYPDTMLYKCEIFQAESGSVTSTIGINPIQSEIKKFSLFQNYPNPFNPDTNIKFTIPKKENVSLKVYDLLGREREVVFSGILNAGTYNAEFNGNNLSSGIYFYVMKTGSYCEKKKMVLIK